MKLRYPTVEMKVLVTKFHIIPKYTKFDTPL